METDFDREICRRGTNSVKWEFRQSEGDLLEWEPTERCFGQNRILPMWVADMDFASPAPVVEALVERARHGIYGYSAPSYSFFEAIVNWMRRRHGWEVAPDWICLTPGVVPALNMLVRTFVAPGEKVLIQPPVYYPFYGAIENNQAGLVANPLLYEDGRYRMDFEQLERSAADPELSMAILCSPHNPVGRVWSREELLRYGEICLKNDLLVVSDEIHADLVYEGHVFIPFASASPEFAQQAVICTSPSKTLNLAGLQTSAVIIPNPELRSRFRATLQANGLFGISAFGLVALEAAYNNGEAWLMQVLAYLEDNLRYLEDFMGRQIPQIRVVRPEGTYLVWLDCRGLGLDRQALKRLMLEKAKVYLDDGYIFGPQGEGFERLNIACPRSILAEALERIRRAVEQL